jgi:hypothetical protein
VNKWCQEGNLLFRFSHSLAHTCIIYDFCDILRSFQCRLCGGVTNYIMRRRVGLSVSPGGHEILSHVPILVLTTLFVLFGFVYLMQPRDEGDMLHPNLPSLPLGSSGTSLSQCKELEGVFKVWKSSTTMHRTKELFSISFGIAWLCAPSISVGQKWWPINLRIKILLNQREDATCTLKA